MKPFDLMLVFTRLPLTQLQAHHSFASPLKCGLESYFSKLNKHLNIMSHSIAFLESIATIITS